MTLLGNLFVLRYPTHAADEPCDALPDGYEYVPNGIPCNAEPILTPTETFEIVTGSTTPTASLSIDGKTSVSDSINSKYGTTNYASHAVSVNVTDAASYELILSGPAQLSGPSTIEATSGATGANLANDTWGYAWENTTVTDSNANYKALASNIKLSVNALSNQAVSFSKKLAFAAKFSENSNAGVYHADVNLSLVATPKVTTTTVTAVPWNKLVYMQDMTPYACMQANIGDTKTLIDVRGKAGANTYTIAKLGDGKCWMTQNLRLSQETSNKGVSLTAHDTNIDATDTWFRYYIPASTTGAFDSSKSGNYYTNQQVRAATDNDYGAYYSYNVATLNKVASQSSGTASYDICPKGWRLPTGGSSREFQALYNKGYSSWTTNNGKNGYWIGATNATGGAFFPAAGYVTTNGLGSTGSNGCYWSSTISNATYAYYLGFGSSYFYPANYSTRYFGFSVRCVAK